MAVTIRVMCWDHPRCTSPMRAAAEVYSARRPELEIRLATRPLALFNDQPVWDLEGAYDLIFIDHPITGAAAERTALVAFDKVLDNDTLARIGAESIGASHRSYTWEGHQWALGVDAASQVAVYREDLLRDLGRSIPRTWDDVLELAAEPHAVALPLYSSDAICTLISLSANAAIAEGDEPTWLRLEGVEMLVELARRVDPMYYSLNPPQLLDLMADDDNSPAYVPFVFGYASLAHSPLSFTDVPGVDGRPRGAILGGAGLAISPSSQHPQEAAGFAAWYASGDTQSDIVLPAGGQPGSRLAWDAASRVGGSPSFFEATRQSIEQAFLRPRAAWWPPFQRDAGTQLVAMMRDGTSPSRIHSELTEMAERYRERVPTP